VKTHEDKYTCISQIWMLRRTVIAENFSAIGEQIAYFPDDFGF